MLDDVGDDPRFAREAAEATGYVPTVPDGGAAPPRATGHSASSSLDRPQDEPFTLAEMDLLGLFANQAAIALDLLGRRARAAIEGDEGRLAVVARLAAELDKLPPDRREAGVELLAALERPARSLNGARRHIAASLPAYFVAGVTTSSERFFP